VIHYHQARISDELVWDGLEDEVVVPSGVQTVLRTCPG